MHHLLNFISTTLRFYYRNLQLTLQRSNGTMSLNPLRLVKSLWSRPHPATNSVDASTTDDNEDTTHPMAQGDESLNDKQAQVEAQGSAPSPTTSADNLEAPTSGLPPNVASAHLEDPFLDNHDASTGFDDGTSEDKSRHGQSHAHHPSIASTVALSDKDSTDKHQDTEAEDSSKQDVSQKEHHEEKIPEVPSDEDDPFSDGASDSQLPDGRRKLIPKHQKSPRVASAKRTIPMMRTARARRNLLLPPRYSMAELHIHHTSRKR